MTIHYRDVYAHISAGHRTDQPVSYVIVPDGLEAAGVAGDEVRPSRAYAAALNWAVRRAGRGDTIYLAPGNRFGGQVTEQEAAQKYLRTHGSEATIVSFDPKVKGYITTRGNARLLRHWLQSQGRWPLQNAVLAAYDLHFPRAKLTFKQEGFEFAEAVWVRPGQFGSTFVIVPRLFFFRHHRLHALLERIAWLLTWGRII